MKRILLLIALILSAVVTASAQPKGTITGKLVDAKTNEPIVGAVIELVNTANPQSKSFHSAEKGGAINIPSLAYGQYKLTITFLGYRNVEKTIRVNSATANLGTIGMEVDAVNIEEITLSVPAMRTSQRGDTVVYNASAFKVTTDADTESLLSKMPGITITDGKVQAQGEEIRKVLVDGKEFFGEDVNSAIKNLPAEVVERIEVFNKLSDQAEFTGFDDGEGFKAINIVTAQSKRQGQFGKLSAGYGINENGDHKYIGGGNVNIFNGDTRVSLIGLANNLNQQNFSFEDILGVTGSGGGGGGRRGGYSFMVRPQDGVASVQSFGVNYSDTWGKNDKVTVTGSYFFNHTNTLNDNFSETWRYVTDGVNFTNSTTASQTDNLNHRFNARIEYKINENQNLMIRPRLSFQGNDSYSNGLDSLWYNDVFSRRTQTANDRDNSGINGGLSTLYRLKLGKPGRTITINADGNVNTNNSLAYSEQIITVLSIPESPVLRRTNNETFGYQLRGGLTYTEPLGQKSQLSVEYRANYSFSDADRKVYEGELDANENVIYDTNYNRDLSSVYTSGYLTQSIGPGYRYSDKKANISASLSYQNASLINNREMPDPATISHSFDDVVYSVMSTFNFNPTNTLRLRANSRTNNPSITQLQDVINDANLNNVSKGNPELKPSYNHNMWANYTLSNVLKGRTLSLSANVNLTSNYIADSTLTINPSQTVPQGLPDGTSSFTMPVNMKGYWNVRGSVSYGFPVKWIRSNINIFTDASYTEAPSITAGIDPNDNNNTISEHMTMNYSSYGGGVSVGSNISENLDFRVSYRAGYGINNSLLGGAIVSNNSFEQFADMTMKWIFWKGLTFSGNARYIQNKGISSDYNTEYVLCNLFLGKKIFRNQRGEISVGVNDLLNEDTGFRRSVGANYITNSTSSVIGRYYTVQFTYNLRNFGKKGSKNPSDYDNLDQPQGNRPIMRGPGGPGGPGGFGGPPPGGFR